MGNIIIMAVGFISLTIAAFMVCCQVRKGSIEKVIPKKIRIVKVNGLLTDYKCPVCGTRCITKMDSEWLAGAFYTHCYLCGQALDWEDI